MTGTAADSLIEKCMRASSDRNDFWERLIGCTDTRVFAEVGVSIWQHPQQYEPTLVFPFAVYFAEAERASRVKHCVPSGVVFVTEFGVRDRESLRGVATDSMRTF
jgi:hypothetical protein